MSAPAMAFEPDLVAGLKRLKLRQFRQLGPEILQTAKTQRWAPEELLRTLVEAEIAARDEAKPIGWRDHLHLDCRVGTRASEFRFRIDLMLTVPFPPVAAL